MGDELPLLGQRSSLARLPEALVRRPRLDSLFADRARRQVTLISAPPGSGKTTLVTTWLASRQRRGVMLTVDARDNERDHLAGVIVAALVHGGAIAPEEIDATLPATTLLDAAFARLEERGGKRVLVLDDLQELTSRHALRTLAYLVERAPATLDVVLCSRADPPIRLTRLRLEGRLGEIRNDALAFDLPETSALLSAHGLTLTRSQVQALWRRTEGWVAGLRLAACALQGEADPAEFVQGAAGTETAIADYLLKELLTRQDAAIQRFMLRTSVVGRLTPDLAEVLTDDPAVSRRLGELERNGVFLAELEDRTWYRYHSLFATLLEARLRQQHRALADELHRRATAWFIANDMPDEAEVHARAAGDWPTVGRLAADRWVARALDGAETNDGLLAGIPARAIATNESLAVLAAAEACARRDRNAADAHGATLDRTAPDLPAGGAGVDALTGSPPLARSLLAIRHARAFGADARARAAIADLRAAGGEADHLATERLADLRAIELDLDEGRIDRARRQATALVRAADSTWVGREALAALALADAVEGDIAAAEDHAGGVLGDPYPPGKVARHMATLALTLCHAQRGEHRHALDALAAVPAPAAADRAVVAVDGAVRAALRAPGSPFVGLDGADAEHPLVMRALVALGVLEALDSTGRVRVMGGPLEEAVVLGRQRWRAGSGAGVISVLSDHHARGARRSHPRTLIERSGLLALGAAERGDRGATVAAIRDALVALESSGIWAPLLVLAPDLTDLLESCADELGPHQGLALELVDRARTSPAPAYVEPLTERETSVLCHLPTLMSNHEIADVMHVSVNTVKTHLKSLYRKLGVASRREAVLRGRALELL
ncbi:MAG TPA: LuxR C-terminal-related transcriptional regulator [Acidimicrobiales bacterium]|nr:LuxR C-terminal-related transcriptional regulator [Acidimicrobiales bacterium]